MSKQIAVVTGANRGLGFATARALAEDDYHVILTARSSEKAETAAQKLADDGVEVQPRVLDVSSDDSVDAFFAWLSEEHGRIDVLVNNAGSTFGGHASTLDVPARTVLEAVDTNTLGAFRMLQHTLPMMNAQGYGRVVDVSTGMAGLTEMNGGSPAYRISKTALNAVTRIFHAEAEQNVKINSVCPGWVRTDMGGPRATRSVEEGIAGIVWAATLDDDGPSGGFFRDGDPIPW